jgi:hypothetical protein
MLWNLRVKEKERPLPRQPIPGESSLITCQQGFDMDTNPSRAHWPPPLLSPHLLWPLLPCLNCPRGMYQDYRRQPLCPKANSKPAYPALFFSFPVEITTKALDYVFPLAPSTSWPTLVLPCVPSVPGVLSYEWFLSSQQSFPYAQSYHTWLKLVLGTLKAIFCNTHSHQSPIGSQASLCSP